MAIDWVQIKFRRHPIVASAILFLALGSASTYFALTVSRNTTKADQAVVTSDATANLLQQIVTFGTNQRVRQLRAICHRSNLGRQAAFDFDLTSGRFRLDERQFARDREAFTLARVLYRSIPEGLRGPPAFVAPGFPMDRPSAAIRCRKALPYPPTKPLIDALTTPPED